MLGIDGYEPEWFDSGVALMDRHADRLALLKGRTLTSHWVVRDLGEGDWFEDTPVVLAFGDQRLEIACWQLDQMAVSWGEIDLSQSLDWYDTDLHLEWQVNWQPLLNEALGAEVTGVWITEHLFKTRLVEGAGPPEQEGWLLSGIELGFGSNRLQVFNGLDKVGIEYGAPASPDWMRRTTVPT
ncbi:MAG: hypothetical protein QNJ81_08305 [Acidimicrobiia bacterium]|nr:hypothetical protein [Acidimicrobiia bacterium]